MPPYRAGTVSSDDDGMSDITPAAPNHKESAIEEDADVDEQLESNLNDQIEEVSGKRARREEEQATVSESPEPEQADSADNGPSKDGEYEVESIIGHKFIKGRVLYEVKWRGWSSDDNTFEPESNLLPDARVILAAYHHKVGGEPRPPSKQVKSSKSRANMKQAHEKNGTDTSPPSKRARRTSNRNSDSVSSAQPAENNEFGTWLPKKSIASWEDLISEVQTVERDELGNLVAYIHFKDGHKTKVAQNKYFKHCPRAMLKFYEAHLNFK